MKNYFVKIAFILISYSVTSSQLFAQRDVNAKNSSTSVCLELGTAWYFLNIEQKFVVKPQHQVGLRFGKSEFDDDRGVSFYSVQLLATYSWRINNSRNHFFEFGSGITRTYAQERQLPNGFISTKTKRDKVSITNPLFTMGYHYQKPKGLLFKALLSNFVNSQKKYHYYPSLALGYTF